MNKIEKREVAVVKSMIYNFGRFFLDYIRESWNCRNVIEVLNFHVDSVEDGFYRSSYYQRFRDEL